MDQLLHAAIAAVVPNTYGVVVPAGAAGPYAVWQRIGGSPGEYLDNEPPQVEDAVVQVDVWSKSLGEVKERVAALAAALRNHKELVVRPTGGPREDFDPDMGLFRASQDFEVSY